MVVPTQNNCCTITFLNVIVATRNNRENNFPVVIFSDLSFKKSSSADLLIRNAEPIFLAFRSPACIAASTSSSETRITKAASAGVITSAMLLLLVADCDEAAPPPAAPVIPLNDWEITLPNPTPAPIPAVSPAPPL